MTKEQVEQVIELAKSKFGGSIANMWQRQFIEFATLVRNAALEQAMQELKVQADYSGSSRRAFYMDAIAHIRNLKEPTP